MLIGVLLDDMLDRALPPRRAPRRALGPIAGARRRALRRAACGAGRCSGGVGSPRSSRRARLARASALRRRRRGRRGRRPRRDRRARPSSTLGRARRRPAATAPEAPRDEPLRRSAHVPRALRIVLLGAAGVAGAVLVLARRPGPVGELEGAAEPDPPHAPHHLQLPAPLAPVARLHAHALGLHRRGGACCTFALVACRACAGTSSSRSSALGFVFGAWGLDVYFMKIVAALGPARDDASPTTRPPARCPGRSSPTR